MISSINVTKSAVSCGFGHIYWRNPQWKATYFSAAIVIKFYDLQKDAMIKKS